MSAEYSKWRSVLKWMLPGVGLGVVVGGASVWWGMRRGLDDEVERRIRVLATEAAGPRVPSPPGAGGLAGGAGRSGGAGGGWSGVPKIEVTDDLEAAFKSLLAIRDPGVRQAALAQFLHKLPVERWGTFLLSMKRLGDRGEFEDQPGSFLAALGMMESTLTFMVQRNPKDLLSLVSETRDGQELNDDAERDEGTASMVLRFWAGHDFPAAMEYFDKQLSGLPPDKQREAAAGLGREFVKRDPAAAFGWIKQLPGEIQANVAHGAFQTLSHVDSAAALKLLVTEKELPNRPEFAEAMAKGWAATKPEEALAWAKGLPEDLAPNAITGAMEHLAQKDFSLAVREAAELPPAQRDAALLALSNGLEDDDPARAESVLQLIGNAPEGPGRAEAAKGALENWTRRDPEAASAWLATQPDGPTREAAIEGLASGAVAAKSDPEAGMEWTAVLSDAGKRGQLLRANVVQWAQYDSEAARAWVQSSARLSAADREVLLPLTRKE